MLAVASFVIVLNLLPDTSEMVKKRDARIASLSQALSDAELAFNAQLAKTNMLDQTILTLTQRLDLETKKNMVSSTQHHHTAALEAKAWALVTATKQLRHQYTANAEAHDLRVAELRAQVEALQRQVNGKEGEAAALQGQITFKATELHVMTLAWDKTKTALKRAEDAVQEYDAALGSKEWELEAFRQNTAGTIHALQGQIEDGQRERVVLEGKVEALGKEVEVRSQAIGEASRLRGQKRALERENEELVERVVELVVVVEGLQEEEEEEDFGEEFGVVGEDGEVVGEMGTMEDLVPSSLEVIEGIEVQGPIAW